MLKFLLKYFIPINLLFDVFLTVLWQKGGNAQIIRGVFLLSIIILSFLKDTNQKIYLPFILFTIYIVIMIPFTSDPAISQKLSLKFLITLWTFPIIFVNSYLFTEKIVIRNIAITSIILIANYFLSTYFGIGISEYTQGTEFLTGNLNDVWPIYVYILFSFIIIFKLPKKSMISNVLYLGMFAFLIVLLLIGLKRSAILVFFAGLIMFLILEKLNYKSIIFSIVGFILVLFFLSKYSFVIEERLYARQYQIEGKILNIIGQESRYLETIAVWDEIFSFNNINESLFGLEAFNSAGNYMNGAFGDRHLHVDYNMIVNTLGLIGLLIYFYIYYYIFNIYRVRRKYLDFKYKELFIIIFVCQFITSFSGQMLSITFGSIKYIFLAISLNKIKY